MGPAPLYRRTWLAALAWLALIWLSLACDAPAWAQSGSTRESAVKAAFLYKFAGFVEWPAGTFSRADEPLVIGVLGNDAVLADLDQVVVGRTLEGRPIRVRRMREDDSAERVPVLLIGATREGRLRELAAAVPGPVLIVTEQPDGLRLGGVLNFVQDGGRIRFTASVTAAEARGLRLSARLLAVAQAVEGRAR